MTTLEEQAEWHEKRAVEEDNDARDLGDCEDGAMTYKLRKMLRDRHEHEAARHRASAAVCRALRQAEVFVRTDGRGDPPAEYRKMKRMIEELNVQLSEIPHA